MGDTRWKTLYRAGAVAPLIALALYSSQFLILIFGDPFPTTTEGWFTLFQRNKLLGLWYLNALDIVSFALLGIMFLALYAALRGLRPSWMLIALYFALLGVVVFIVPRALTLALLPLSDMHSAATTEEVRVMYLTAGEALSHLSTATPQTLGSLFMAVAGLIISLVVMKSRSFGRSSALAKAVGYVGIVGFVVALANYVAWLIAPSHRGRPYAHQWPALAHMVDHDERRAFSSGQGHREPGGRFPGRVKENWMLKENQAAVGETREAEGFTSRAAAIAGELQALAAA